MENCNSAAARGASESKLISLLVYLVVNMASFFSKIDCHYFFQRQMRIAYLGILFQHYLYLKTNDNALKLLSIFIINFF